MPEQKKVKCPICKGHGEIVPAKKTSEARQRRRSDIANKLRAEGYSIREIMALMGYKSTTSVQLLLKK